MLIWCQQMTPSWTANYSLSCIPYWQISCMSVSPSIVLLTALSLQIRLVSLSATFHFPGWPVSTVIHKRQPSILSFNQLCLADSGISAVGGNEVINIKFTVLFLNVLYIVPDHKDLIVINVYMIESFIILKETFFLYKLVQFSEVLIKCLCHALAKIKQIPHRYNTAALFSKSWNFTFFHKGYLF